jgi:hypothetical protein
MARAPKPGLKYFNLDVGFYSDDKILLAEEYIDPKGDQPILRLLCAYIYVRLLDKIYKDNGFYIEWNEKIALTFSSSIGKGLTFELLKKFISVFLESELFDKIAYMNDGILTSKSIIERYIFIIRNSNKKVPLLAAMDMQKNYNYLKPDSGGTDSLKGGTDSLKGGTVSPLNNTIVSFTNTNNDLIDNTNKSKIVEEKHVSGGTDSLKGGTDSLKGGTDSLKGGTDSLKGGTDSLKGGTEYSNVEKLLFVDGSEIPSEREMVKFKTQDSPILQIEHCLYFFMTDESFFRTREQLQKKCFKVSDKSAESSFCRLIKWGRAFNRELLAGGITKRKIRGAGGSDDSWSLHFNRWFLKRDMTLDPDRYEEQRSPKHTSPQKVQTTSHLTEVSKMTEEQQREYYGVKPKSK